MRLVSVLLTSSLCGGCGTFIGHSLPGSRAVYIGVRCDVGLIAGGDRDYIFDVPFSAVGDTLLLPYDLAMLTRLEPLGEDWTPEVPGPRDVNRALREDYESFIRTLNLASPDYWLTFYSHPSGRHAVKITTETKRDYMNYALFYEKSDARTKVVKWRERKVSFHT